MVEIYKQVSKDYEENLDYRRWMLVKAKSSDKWQGWIKRACAKDVLFWINTFGWQFNPKIKTREVGPFITWDFQDEAVHRVQWCLDNGRDLVIEKSREMGASWLCLFIMDGICRFRKFQKFLLISRNADAVDRSGDPDCLMWKMDFINRFLPDWMKLGKIDRRKMGIGYVDTESAVTGQASTGKAGVGGRATGAFIDEFSRIDDGRAILEGTADTTDCRIFNFTHYGTEGPAHELSRRPDIMKLRMHWSQHPLKNLGLYKYDSDICQVQILDKQYVYPTDYQFVMDGKPSGGPYPGLRSPWYDDQCVRRNDSRAVAMHLDIDPGGSSEQFFDPIVIRQLIAEYAEPFPALWEGELDYDVATGKPVSLVRMSGGKLKLWINPDVKGNVPLGDYVIGADVAAGTGATPSCLSIVDKNTGEKVGRYMNGLIKAEDFAVLTVALCWHFRQVEGGDGAYLIWERQGPGTLFGTKVIDLGYRRVYYKTNEYSLSKEQSDSPGWMPNTDNKGGTLAEYRTALYGRQFVNRDKEALEETLMFQYTPKGTVEHSGTLRPKDNSGATINHGDLVVSDMLACKGADLNRKRIQRARQVEEVSVNSLAWRRMLHDNARQQAYS